MKEQNRSGRWAASGLCAIVAAGTLVAAGAQEPTLVEHMHEHYGAVVKVQSAIIRGDLEAIREPAEWLAEHPVPAAMPAQWETHVEPMRAAARSALKATDFSSAATAASLMGTACGGCHIANNVSVEFAMADDPAYASDSISHMLRHQWAADRMWEGIVGPSEPAWGQGIDVLLEAPLTAEELDSQQDETRQMARRIHQLAANGMMAVDASEKAEIYAEFLANCAACHTALDKGPGR